MGYPAKATATSLQSCPTLCAPLTSPKFKDKLKSVRRTLKGQGSSDGQATIICESFIFVTDSNCSYEIS